jgi:hypothetical protein
MTGYGVPGRLGVLLPKGSAALDVGEQERDRAGRQGSGGIHGCALHDHVGSAESNSLGVSGRATRCICMTFEGGVIDGFSGRK